MYRALFGRKYLCSSTSSLFGELRRTGGDGSCCITPPRASFSGASMLLVACSDKILWHAAEARPYSSDVLIASVLALLFIVSHKWTARRRALFFAGLAPFVILASYPGVFLLGGITIALVFVLIRQKQNAPTWLALIVIGVSIAGTFLILFLTTAFAQRTTTLNAQWAYAFPDWRHPTHVPLWLIRATIEVFDYTMRPTGGILALAACIGAVSWWRAGERELIVFLVAPLALAAAAGLTHAYPYTGVRTMAFVMPALALLVGAGVQAPEIGAMDLKGVPGWPALSSPCRSSPRCFYHFTAFAFPGDALIPAAPQHTCWNIEPDPSQSRLINGNTSITFGISMECFTRSCAFSRIKPGLHAIGSY